jgi:hypothetical protein
VSPLFAALSAVAPSPTPFPDYTGDPNLITPGVIGFIAIFLVALVTVFLLIDMNRRIRRTRYREEVREKLAEEDAAAQAQAEADARRAGRKKPPTIP